MGSYSKTFARKQAEAKAHVASLMAAAQQGDPAAIAELDRGARTADGNIPGTSRGAVNVYRQALVQLGDPSHRGNGLRNMARTKNALQQVGGVVKKLAPLAVFIPGVGPIAAGALAAAGGLASGDSLGKSALEGVGAGVTGGAINAARGAIAAHGVVGAAEGALGAAPAAGGGGIGGLARSALSYAEHNPAKIIGAVGAINAAHQQAKGSDAIDEAANLRTAEYNRLAPVRQAASAAALAPVPAQRDLSYLRDPGNPYQPKPPVPTPVTAYNPALPVPAAPAAQFRPLGR